MISSFGKWRVPLLFFSIQFLFFQAFKNVLFCLFFFKPVWICNLYVSCFEFAYFVFFFHRLSFFCSQTTNTIQMDVLKTIKCQISDFQPLTTVQTTVVEPTDPKMQFHLII